jgi:hypothetical protein
MFKSILYQIQDLREIIEHQLPAVTAVNKVTVGANVDAAFTLTCNLPHNNLAEFCNWMKEVSNDQFKFKQIVRLYVSKPTQAKSNAI